VPDGATAVGNPARVILKNHAPDSQSTAHSAVFQ
jgi:acetyltransferase-like isoleucine patch superfamily enzyme